jgi:cation:H+ antiporter
MLVIWFSLAAGLVLLYGGAELLVRGSADMARRLGVSPLVVGLTIVAFGTSAPELVVSIRAGLDRLGNIAVGNVVGSNIFNITVILAVSALVRPLKVNLQVVRLDTPILVAVSVFLLALLRDLRLDRTEGLLLCAGIVAYTALSVALARRAADASAREHMHDRARITARDVLLDITLIASGLVALVFGSQLLVKGAVGLARQLRVGEAMIGLTIVAAGTSLPELATSIVAAGKKEADIAIGNIVGSNIFNILAILGTASVIAPLSCPGISPVDLGFMLGTTVVALPFMWSGFVLNRTEAVLLLSSFCLYLWYLWP